MAFFGNYQRPGPGVDKNAPRKKRFFYFFELAWRKIWQLIQLNLIYVLFMLPTLGTLVWIGSTIFYMFDQQMGFSYLPLLPLCLLLALTMLLAGPATAGLTYVLRNMVREKGVFLWSDFIDSFKKNWKPSALVGVIDVVAALLFSIAIPFYYQSMGDNIAMFLGFGASVAIALIFVMMHYYIFLMIVSTTLKLKQIFKNALILVGAGMKTNLITTLFVFLLMVPLILFVPKELLPLTLVFYLFILFSLTGFVICYNSFPYIQKYVIDPYYAEHEDEQEKIDEEALFTDIGTEEKPAAQPSAKRPSDQDKPKRGKTIS